MTKNLNDERLSAYLDGELDDATRAEVERHLAGSLEDRARLEHMRSVDARLRQAFPLDTSVPQNLLSAAGGATAKVVQLQTRPAVRRPLLWSGLAAAAAAAVLVISLPTLWLTGPAQTRGSSGLHVAAGPVMSPDLRVALGTVPSGTGKALPSGLRFEAQASFQIADGRLCREFLVLGVPEDRYDHGVACASAPLDGAWSVVVVAVQSAAPVQDGFAPAVGADQVAVDAMLDALGAGLALSAEEEAEVLR